MSKTLEAMDRDAKIRKLTRAEVDRLLATTVEKRRALELTEENMSEIVRLNKLRDACRIFIRSRSHRRDRARSTDAPSAEQYDLILAAFAN